MGALTPPPLRAPVWHRSPTGAAENTRRLASWIFCGLLISATVVLNQSAVHWRENVVDSHLFAYYGWCVWQGARPYLDVWDNKPPGIWWVNAAGFALCGEGIGGEVLVCTVALGVSLAVFLGIARLAYHRTPALLATATGSALLAHLVCEGGANRTETFVVACESVAILGYLHWWRRGANWALAVAGLAAGAAPLFKQAGLAAGAACVLHLAWTQFRAWRDSEAPCPWKPRWWPWVVLGVAGALVPLFAGATLAMQGALGEAWFAVATFNRAYFAVGDATWWRMERAWDAYAEVLPPLQGVFVAAAVGLLWAAGTWWRALRKGRRFRGATAGGGAGRYDPVARVEDRPNVVGAAHEGRRTGVELFWLWFLLSAYLACVGPGRRGHHFMPVLPALGLLALYPLHRVAAGQGLAARLIARPTSAVIVVLYVLLLAHLAVSNVSELASCWQRKPHWYALTYAQAPDYVRQAAEVRRLTRAGEPIYVWGWSPGTYRYAYRRPASRFATLEKVGRVRDHAQFIFEAALRDVRRTAPNVLVCSPRDLRGLREQSPGDFGRWLDEHYEDRGIVGGMHILQARRGGLGP